MGQVKAMGRKKSKIKKKQRKIREARKLQDHISKHGYTQELKLQVLLKRNEITDREYQEYMKELEK